MNDRQIKVLLIEDNQGDVNLIKEMLSEETDAVSKIDCVDRLDAGLKRLSEGGIDIVLLDLGLPDSQGLDTFVKVFCQEREVPIVVLTGLFDEELGLASIQKGAQDYLVKGQVEGSLLIRAMRYAIERKKTEKEIAHLNSVLRTIRQVNQFISNEKDRSIILEGVCNVLIKDRSYHNAWIALSDERGRLVMNAGAGLDDDFLHVIERLRGGDLPDCAQRALLQSNVVSIVDPSSTCADCPQSSKYGDRGMMIMRLEYGEKIFGLLAVQVPKDFARNNEEQGLFEEVAGDISFALYNIELGRERGHAEAALRRNEEKYRTLTDNVNVGVYRNTPKPKGKFIEANPAIVEMFGYKSKKELLSINVADLYQNPEDMIKFNEKILSSGFVRNEELQLKKKDGKSFNASASGVAVKDEKGKVKYCDGIIEDITERKQAEEQIKASLREKEVLLQEVHHRVKNNMQIISSLLRLQSRKIKGKQALQAFESSCNRVKSMVLIHERLYQSRDFARVDFAEYVHGLTNHLFSLYQMNPEAVKLSIDIKDIFLDLNTAIPCGLIVNELVSNSLKHAFPDGRTGKIKIVMKSLKKNEIELTASDNGVGIPEDVDFRETESLGLHLVSILAEDQLRGKIKLDKTKGTRFEIKFKAKQ